MTTTRTTAASLIDQMLDKHNEVERAEQKAVAPAVACGKLLRLAKESVKAERKKWKDWLDANIEFSQETVSIYMRLAENEKLIAKAQSIREALKAITPNQNRAAGRANKGGPASNSPTATTTSDLGRLANSNEQPTCHHQQRRWQNGHRELGTIIA